MMRILKNQKIKIKKLFQVCSCCCNNQSFCYRCFTCSCNCCCSYFISSWFEYTTTVTDPIQSTMRTISRSCQNFCSPTVNVEYHFVYGTINYSMESYSVGIPRNCKTCNCSTTSCCTGYWHCTDYW